MAAVLGGAAGGLLFLLCMSAPASGAGGSRFDPGAVSPLQPDPDIRVLGVAELVKSHGYNGREYKVVTEDGYILSLFRITKGDGPPVIFMNGLALGPQLWVIHGPGHDLPFVLSDLGYDIWIATPRGVVDSDQHTVLKNDQPEFWDFSHDESGFYDLPAIIDLVLRETGHKKAFYIGTSLAGALLMVMCSERPEYCAKVAGNVLFVPAMWSASWDQLPFSTKIVVSVLSHIMKISRSMGIHYTLRPQSLQYLSQNICSSYFGEELCFLILEFKIGFNRANMAPGWLTKTMLYSTAGASVRQIEHLKQLTHSGGGARKYDWGEEGNIKKYGSPIPPSYNLSRITSPTIVYYSQNDRFIPLEAMKKTISLIGNLKKARPALDPTYGHAEFVFGKDLYKMFYSEIVDFFDSISGLAEDGNDKNTCSAVFYEAIKSAQCNGTL